MRVFKKIATPFVKARPTHAFIITNAVDPQTNTIKAFMKACHDSKIDMVVVANKIDKVENKKEVLEKIGDELETFNVIGISAKDGTNFDYMFKQLNIWMGGRVIILGVFNSGKTSVINRLCGTKHKVGDIPGTTLKFKETKYKKDTIVIDSVGQLIDIHKPMMVSIDFSDCKTSTEKINKVFVEEIKGLVDTRKSVLIEPILPLLRKSIESGGKIIVTGAGASALVAKEMAGQGTECGIPIMAFTNDYAEAQPISFSKGVGEEEMGLSKYFSLAVTSKDIVIGVSASGGTGFVYDFMKRAREKKAVTIAITENPDTPMGMQADVVIKSDAKPEGPSSSKIQTAHLVIVHTLMLVLADEMGVSADKSIKHMLPEYVESKKMGIK